MNTIRFLLPLAAALLLVVIFLLSTGCGIDLTRDAKAGQVSRERYRKSYERSGGFDPISKSVRQNMR